MKVGIISIYLLKDLKPLNQHCTVSRKTFLAVLKPKAMAQHELKLKLNLDVQEWVWVKLHHKLPSDDFCECDRVGPTIFSWQINLQKYYTCNKSMGTVIYKEITKEMF